MTITTYQTLIDAIVETLEDSTVETPAPRFIQLAEARFNRLLFDIDAEATATTSTTAGDNTIAFPTRFRQARALRIGSDPTNVLKQLSIDDLNAKWADASTGQPEDYAISGGQFFLGATPDDEYTVTITYVKGILPLSDSNATNWLLDAHPDLYFYGSLLHAEFYGWNDERLPLMKQAVDEMLGEIKVADAMRRHGSTAGTVAGTYF